MTGTKIHPLLSERYSPVIYSDKALTQDMIDALFEAARWAPSSYNEQPWYFVYALKSDEGREALESLLVDGNAWAKNAGLLLISFAKKTFTANGKENRVALHDLGAANFSIALQATALGLVSHQMGGFFVDKANVLLGVPEDFEPASMMAIGYLGDASASSQELRDKEKKPRTRKAVDTFAFRNRFAA